MDIVIGIAFWGGLLWVTLAWLFGSGSSPLASPPHQRPASSDAALPTPPPGSKPTAAGSHAHDESRLREDDALVDGLVIGHFLTRDHFRRRIDYLEGSLEAIEDERALWLDDSVAGDCDDLEHGSDFAEFDAMGGFGVEPWADDLFDLDDD